MTLKCDGHFNFARRGLEYQVSAANLLVRQRPSFIAQRSGSCGITRARELQGTRFLLTLRLIAMIGGVATMYLTIQSVYRNRRVTSSASPILFRDSRST
jgi:hypothetical protein